VRFTGPISSAFRLSPVFAAVDTLFIWLWDATAPLFSLPPMAAATASAVAIVEEEEAEAMIFVGGLSFEIYMRFKSRQL
jgi:hypothetical protein